MLFEINEPVFLNGEINTNRYPRGDIGVNDIKTIFANNIKGTIFDVELPSLFNKGQFLYTVKIFENLYGIEITQNKINKIPLGSGGIIHFTNSNPNLNPNLNLNPTIPGGLTQLNDINQYNNLNKSNFINTQISLQNSIYNNLNLNSDKNIQKTITKYFYYKIIDDWLYKELFSLLAFVELINGKPQLIKSLTKYSVGNLASETDEQIDSRVNYFELNIITKKLVNQILKKIVKRMCINWYDLDKNEKIVKKIFLEYLKKLLEESIKSI